MPYVCQINAVMITVSEPVVEEVLRRGGKKSVTNSVK